MSAWMYEGNGLKLMREFYAKYNIVNFPGGNTGAQMGGWYRKEIKSRQADIKGLKMRIGGFAGKVLERMGGVPQNIPGGEIYQALEKGTIDAAEWVGPYDDQKLGFNKVAPYYYYPGWWEGGPAAGLLHQQQGLRRAHAENKAIVEAAAAQAHIEMQAKYDAKNPARSSSWWARAPSCGLSRRRDERRLQGVHGAVRRAQRQERKLEEDLRRPTPSSAPTRTCGSASPRPRSTASCKPRSCNSRGAFAPRQEFASRLSQAAFLFQET
jgi:hypothetical protein